MMTRSAFCKLTCLAVVLMTVQLGSSTSTLNAQCFGSAPGVPMWEIYGINPFNPRVRTPRSFTPLQAQIVQAASQVCPANQLVGCQLVNCCNVTKEGQIYVGQVTNLDDTVMANPILLDSKADPSKVIQGDVIKGGSEAGSISSPSDIVVAPKSEGEPTRAAIPSSEMKAELESARSEIEKLNAELTETRAKARISAERAYAAEKAAKAAGAKVKKPKK